jgi:hypothetical protein
MPTDCGEEYHVCAVRKYECAKRAIRSREALTAEANPKNRNSRYLAADKGISLNFPLDRELAILFFKTADFNRSPEPWARYFANYTSRQKPLEGVFTLVRWQ